VPLCSPNATTLHLTHRCYVEQIDSAHAASNTLFIGALQIQVSLRMGIMHFYRHSQQKNLKSKHNMSYYRVYESSIVDYMVCSGCDDEAFTWMAEIFCCPNCGGTQYVDPVFNDLHFEDVVDEAANGTSGDGGDKLKRKASRTTK
jgi:hypothetical protein